MSATAKYTTALSTIANAMPRGTVRCGSRTSSPISTADSIPRNRVIISGTAASAAIQPLASTGPMVATLPCGSPVPTNTASTASSITISRVCTREATTTPR